MAFFAVCGLLTLPCYAAVELDSDIENHTYTISGTVEEAGFNQSVSVAVKDSAGNNVFYGGEKTDNNGAFSYTFKLSGVGSGEYTAYIGAYNLENPIKVEPNILFVSDTDINALITPINDIKAKYKTGTISLEDACDDIAEILGDEHNQDVLEINSELYKLLGSSSTLEIAEEVLEKAPYNLLSGISGVANDKMAIELIEGATSNNIETIISEMWDIYNFESCTVYSLYEELETKKAVLLRIIGTEFEDMTKLRSGFEQSVLLEYLYVSENIADATKLYDDYADLFSIDFTEYKDWTNRDLAIASRKVYFKDVDELEDALDKAYKKSGSDDGKGGSTGGSTGGRGSNSGSGSVSAGTSPGVIVTPEQPIGDVFNDMASSVWAKEAVEALYKKGVVSGTGDGSFEPERSVTREEFVKMAAIAFDLEDSSAACEFTDVEDDRWSYSYIAAMAEKGLVFGVGDGNFNAEGVITRQDMALIIKRIADYKELSLEKLREYTGFTDGSGISDYAFEAVQYLYECGVVNGFEDGSFKPQDTTTRAQAASLIYNMLSNGKE